MKYRIRTFLSELVMLACIFVISGAALFLGTF